jgi:8-oxo-dGTP diphosphatase
MDWKNPKPTVDVIIRQGDDLVLIRRANPPHGWALPGGFVDEGEPVEQAAVREALEETGLDVRLDELLYVYSDPARDRRMHTISIVFTATADGLPLGGDDAAEARRFPLASLRAALLLPSPALDGLGLAFDHGQILSDYLRLIDDGIRPRPVHAQR